MPHRMSHTTPVASLIRCAALGAGILLAASCGGVTSSQVVARDRATTVSCDWYQGCDQIGAGKTYETRESCDTQVRAQWDQAWPLTECDGRINQKQLSVCLDAIHATQCGNLLDIVSTLGVKCPKTSICSGP